MQPCLLLRASGLSDRLRGDIELKLDGNPAQFEGLMASLQRMTHAEKQSGSSIPELSKQRCEEQRDADWPWHGGGWSDWHDDYPGKWWDDRGGWSQDDWSRHIPATSTPTEQAPTSAAAPESQDEHCGKSKNKKGQSS